MKKENEFHYLKCRY